MIAEEETSKEERPPVHPKVKVKDWKTLRKTDRWWYLISDQESFGRREVALYLFHKEKEKWRRKQKFAVKNYSFWREINKTVQDMFKGRKK